MSAVTSQKRLTVQVVGGPTVVLEIGGLRLITDPTFDPPGSYDTGRGFELTKLRGPAIGPEELGVVDAALVSHEHHFDNLDREGRAYLAGIAFEEKPERRNLRLKDPRVVGDGVL